MRKIPWNTIIILTAIVVVLVLGRTAVTIGRGVYYGYDATNKMLEDPWFYIGLVCLVICGLSGGLQWLLTRRKKEKNSCDP